MINKCKGIKLTAEAQRRGKTTYRTAKSAKSAEDSCKEAERIVYRPHFLLFLTEENRIFATFFKLSYHDHSIQSIAPLRQA